FTFSLEELLEKNFDIPIYQIWDYAYNSKIDNSEISNLKNILNKYDIEFKTKILSILDKSSKNIIKINDKINDDLLILSNDLSSRWFSLKDEEFQSRLDKIKDLLNEFKNENLTFFFKFYYEMFQIYNNFKEEYEQQQKNEADSDESIFDIEKKLKFLKQFNSSSNNIIQQKLLIRDLKFENTFFKNQLKDIIKRNKKYKKYIIYKIKNNIKTNKRKIQLLTSNTKEYLYLYKKIAVKKKSLSFWKYYVNKAKYLDTNELSNIVKAIINEEEFFILNNLSTISELSGFWDKWKIKARIFNNYNFIFNSYIENSRNKKIFLNQEAQKRADMIKEIEKIKFKNKLDLSKQLEQQKFNDFIKLHKAEYRWNKQSRDKLFKTTILKSAPKVKRFEKNLKKQIRSIEATVKVIADVVDKKSKVSNKINELNQFVNTNLNSFESFSKWPLVSSFIYELISFLSNKFLFSNQFALSFLAIQKMILAMSFVSINFSSYLKSYFENEIDDVIKLKLIKILITQPKLAFVKDDESVITNQIRKDFLNILNIICSNNK
ncbi:MAG1360 family OppF-related protein, partial [Mycoplasmopsis pullorum]|uniref:MAG1360 family OppF-related protein n=1 Tax=Mycoplasmopsis pullorum TaxID=48003 RepID=UPI0015D639B1